MALVVGAGIVAFAVYKLRLKRNPVAAAETDERSFQDADMKKARFYEADEVNEAVNEELDEGHKGQIREATRKAAQERFSHLKFARPSWALTSRWGAVRPPTLDY